MYFFFFKQKTAYEIYQCDWSSDVCSSDLDEADQIQIGDHAVTVWKQGYVGPVYTTSLNLIILQLERA